MLNYRIATLDDLEVLARMNRFLVEDEKHRNRFKPDSWLEDRMRRFLEGDYEAVLFERNAEVVAYALYGKHFDHDDTIHLRQIFVARSCRRQGIGRQVMKILTERIWPRNKRITVGVLAGNDVARPFYEAVGFKPYSMELEMLPSERSAPPG